MVKVWAGGRTSPNWASKDDGGGAGIEVFRLTRKRWGRAGTLYSDMATLNKVIKQSKMQRKMKPI